jgi:hypothetical protein
MAEPLRRHKHSRLVSKNIEMSGGEVEFAKVVPGRRSGNGQGSGIALAGVERRSCQFSPFPARMVTTLNG